MGARKSSVFPLSRRWVVSALLLGCSPAVAPTIVHREGDDSAGPVQSRAQRANVTGRLRYRDGRPAVGVPYEIEVDGVFQVGTSAAQGAVHAEALLPPGATTVNLRLLDGFGLGLDPNAAGLGASRLAVTCSEPGRLPDVYLLTVPKAMVLVTIPKPSTPELTRAFVSLDLIGVHREGELITRLSPEDVVQLRAQGAEVLVLDIDASGYAAKTNAMTDAERIQHIDRRIELARRELRRLD